MKRLSSYIKYYRDARTIYNVHSPLVYSFIMEVLDTSRNYYHYEDIEHLRKRLLGLNKMIPVQDYGAGSRQNNNSEQSISSIAKRALSSPDEGRKINNLCLHYSAKTVLELGTSFGISTAYMAMGIPSGHVYTIEGNPSTAYIAEQNFDLLGIKNISQKTGQFLDVLPPLLDEIDSIDVAYIDGHHTYQATVDNFSMIQPSLSKKSVVLFDDVRWSEGMIKAWEELSLIPGFLALETMNRGYLIKDPQIIHNQKLSYIDYKWKPWKIGLKSN